MQGIWHPCIYFYHLNRVENVFFLLEKANPTFCVKERDGWGEEREREGEISPFLDRKKVKGKEGGRRRLVREGGWLERRKGEGE